MTWNASPYFYLLNMFDTNLKTTTVSVKLNWMAYSELPWRPFLGHQAWKWTTLRRCNVFYYVYKRFFYFCHVFTFFNIFLFLFERFLYLFWTRSDAYWRCLHSRLHARCRVYGCNYRVSVCLSRRLQPPFDPFLPLAPELSSSPGAGR